MPTYVWLFMIIAACILLIPAKKGGRTFIPKIKNTGLPKIKDAIQPKQNELYQYKEKPLMTPTELKFFTLLENSCPELRFHAQVCMGALLDPRIPRSSRYFLQSRDKISRKIIDFVAQDKNTGKVIALIELDDNTHDLAKDKERDTFTASAGFRTVRWHVERQPDVMDIRRALLQPDTSPKTELAPVVNQPILLSSDIDPYYIFPNDSGTLTVPVWLKYLMWFIIFICAMYIIKPLFSKNIKPVAKHANVSNMAEQPLVPQTQQSSTSVPTVISATNNDTAKNTFNSMFKMLDSDMNTWRVDRNPDSILQLSTNMLSYKKMISEVKPTECMSLPYRRINIGLDAYIAAGDVLRNGLRNPPVAFNNYVTNISRAKIEDNNEFTARMRLRLDLSAGHSTEPSYIAHRLTVFGTTMVSYGRETMRGCY